MTLYFGDVRARLGSEENMEEKVGGCSSFCPARRGKKASSDWKIIPAAGKMFPSSWTIDRIMQTFFEKKGKSPPEAFRRQKSEKRGCFIRKIII